MGIVGAGHSRPDFLERKTSPMWLERDLKALVSAEYRSRGIGESAFISQANRRAFKAIKRASSRWTLVEAVRDAPLDESEPDGGGAGGRSTRHASLL